MAVSPSTLAPYGNYATKLFCRKTLPNKHLYLGEYGFVLPADQINGTGAEFLAALKVVTEHIIQEARKDPYFNKPKLKQDTDYFVLENILRRKQYQLTDSDRKSQPSNISKQSIDNKNRSLKFTTNPVTSLFTFLVIVLVTFSQNG